jgi:hypothetical protein
MGSEILSSHLSGFMLFVYLVTCIVTMVLAIGSLTLQREEYNDHCNAADFCSPFTYSLPFVLPHQLSLTAFS